MSTDDKNGPRFELPSREVLRKYTQEDLSASLLRVTLAAAGPVGAVIGEFATVLVPRQRLERLGDLMDRLGERIDDLEALRARIESSPAFAALLEDATRAAAHAPSADRRRDIAELVHTGMSKTEVQLVEHQRLLAILERLNEAELLILMSYYVQGFNRSVETEDFLRRHRDVIAPTPPSLHKHDIEQVDRFAMFNHYTANLVSMGLLQQEDSHIKGRMNTRIARLGVMLLKAIGQPVFKEPQSTANLGLR